MNHERHIWFQLLLVGVIVYWIAILVKFSQFSHG